MEDKPWEMLNLVTQLFKIYFRINKVHLCKPLIQSMEMLAFSKNDCIIVADQITYQYFVGRIAIFESDYKRADEALSYAFKYCFKDSTRNKRMILIYLVPLKILLGYMPKLEMLERYNLPQYYALVSAVKDGNIAKFEQIIYHHMEFFISRGVFPILLQLKTIVYRNLFKKVHTIMRANKIDLEVFSAALKVSTQHEISIEETTSIIGNLIYAGKIRGYVSQQYQTLVLAGTNVFPITK